MVFVLSFGSYTVITSQGMDLDVGQMSSLLTYSFQILMSLMMLSMIFVMITMSTESAERIVEVLYRGEHPAQSGKPGDGGKGRLHRLSTMSALNIPKRPPATPFPTLTCTSSRERSSAFWAAPVPPRPR